MIAPKKQSDEEIIKQLLAEGMRRDAAELRFRRILFWTIFIVMEIVAVSYAVACVWRVHSFWYVVMDLAIIFVVSTIFFLKLRSLFNIASYDTKKNVSNRFATILDMGLLSFRWPRWP